MTYSVGLLIISDRAASGERPDGCLPVFKEMLENTTFKIANSQIVSDTPEEIKAALQSFITNKIQLVITSGGTGCAPRDNTPEVTASLLERPTPGVDEALRAYSATKAKFAIYSRGVSGIVGATFIINLPGSPKAVRESLEFLLPTLEHPLKLLASQISDCASEV